jgi:pimeloyl-ACP methyl ester carboxylesterase
LSETVAGRWTTSMFAKDAISLLDHLKWHENVHIVGLSMGGMIAQEICKADPMPSRIASLTLISTIAGGLFSLAYFMASIPTGIRHMAKTTMGSNGRERLKSALLTMYPQSFLDQEVTHPETGQLTTNFNIFRKRLIKRAVVEKEKGIPQPSLTTIIKQTLAVTTHYTSPEDMQRIKKRVHGNVLVITGDDDILVHSANSLKLHQGFNCKLVVIPGGGHGAFEQFADQVNAEISQLIDQAISSPRQTTTSSTSKL